MTKIKIAALIACLLTTGAFAGFTYQAVNSDHEKENVTVIAVDENSDELVTDDETTVDEETTDEETTDDETTAEETVVIVLADPDEKAEDKAAKTETAPAVTTAPAETAAPAEEAVTEILFEMGNYEAPAEESYYEDYWYESEYEDRDNEENYEETTEAPAEDDPEEDRPEQSGRAIEVTEEEYIWICNIVGREYGADWISDYEKAKVVEVIMNRVNDPRFPDTIYGVLTQPHQFEGAIYLNTGTFTNRVTDSVKAAVDLYLEHPEDFGHGYLGYWGDGYMNHFYTV